MESRIAVMGIIIEDMTCVQELNQILSDFGEFIIGRMGIPYKKNDIHIMSIALDAPNDIISSLAGKIGRLKDISVKTAYASKTSSC